MSKETVPTVEQLKRAALSDDLMAQIALHASDVIMLSALASIGQAVAALRHQVEVIGEARDPISTSILKTHRRAERTLDDCAKAAHMVLNDWEERAARAEAARYN